MIKNRTETIYVTDNPQLSHFCHCSKNLYNAANYTIRKEFFENNKWIRYNNMDKLMREKEPEYNDYRTLPAHSAQQTLRRLDKVWTSFFRSIKDWAKHKSKYKGQPKPPKYLKKDGQTVLAFTNQQCKIKNGTLKFPKMIGFEVKTRLPDNTNIREVRVVPMGVGHNIEIVYKIDIPELKPKKNRIGAIDIGLNNLVTFGDNIGGDPIIIKGGYVKSMNQYYNKERAKLRSIYDHQNIKGGRRSRHLDLKRYHKLKDAMHKSSRTIVNECVERDIDTLVIGHNDGWKQDIEIGKRNNQNFVSVPFNMLISHIQYKCEAMGIEVILHEEAYTSKCSFLDDEDICHHDKYVGKRVHRGLFRTADGRKINADVNGMYNIMKKAVPKAFADGIEGVGLHPIRLSGDIL